MPASGVQPGTLPVGVNLPANQITGAINPATQIGAGSLPTSVTLSNASQLPGAFNGTGCSNNQILVFNGTNFVCTNPPSIPSAPVASVFGRTGVVTQQAGDYSANLITNISAGNINATNLQDAINELDAEKLNLSGGTLSGVLNLGTNRITNLAAPTAATDAATRAYVDAQIAGVPSGADNLGDHTATQNITLGSNFLSGDGDAEGVFVDADGNVGIGTATPFQELTVDQDIESERIFLGVGGDSSLFASQSIIQSGDGLTLMNGASSRYYSTGSVTATEHMSIFADAPQSLTISGPSTGNPKSISFVQNSTGLLTTDFEGRLITKPIVDIAQAFEVQNANGSSLLRVDSTSGNVGIGLSLIHI